MYPDKLFDLAGFRIDLYILFYALAVLLSAAWGFRLAGRRSLGADVTVNGAAVFLVATLLGGKIYEYFRGGGTFAALERTGFGGLLFHGGFAALGAIAGSLLALWIFSRWHPATRSRPFEGLDVVVPPMSLAYGIARLGCLSAGCCYGKPAPGLPWALTFVHPNTACAFKGLPVHPTQIYELGANLLLSGLLGVLFSRKSWRGLLVWVYLFGYGTLRFTIEFFRGDVRRMLGPISFDQATCLVFIFIGGLMLAKSYRIRVGTGIPSGPLTGGADR